MIFYLVWEQKCDDLIAWYLMEKRNDDGLKDVVDIIRVYALLHKNSKLAKTVQTMMNESGNVNFGVDEWQMSDAIQVLLIRAYIELASNKSMKLHSALETLLEVRERNQIAEKDLLRNS